MAEELTEDRISEYQMAFSIYDRDGHGTITAEELGSVMKSLGQHPEESELQEIINEVDIDGDHAVDFTEFLVMMQKTEENEDDYLREAFKLFDKDNSGFISQEELRRVMINLGDAPTNDEVAEMIREGDLDGDGLVNFEEFKKMMTAK